MLVLSRNLVLTEGTADDPRLPLIGRHSVVTAANVTADSAAPDYPVSNLANPLTYRLWKAADTAAQRIVIATGTEDALDYIGVAGHNYGSAQIPVKIEGRFDLEDEEEEWTELVQETILPGDKPALFRFERQSYALLSILHGTGNAPAEAAVLHAGRLLALDPGIELPFTPLPFARESAVAAGRSVGGHYLGEIELSEFLRTSITAAHMHPDWYRANMEPFLAARPRRPFFHAWDPVNHPFETGYAWLLGNPRPSIDHAGRRMSVTLEIAGIA